MKASTRVIVNTGVQYLRTGFAVIISLFTTRIVLENLGVNDYGIFNLVGGVISMLAFIQYNLSGSTQRFLSYYHGKNDFETIRNIFNNSLITQLIISVVLCLGLLAFTPLIFSHLLNIAPERQHAAKIVYYISILSLFFNFQSTPYLATLISRENIIYSTIIQFISTILKIPVAYSLIIVSETQRLSWYSGCISLLIIFEFICYRTYCRRHYEECGPLSFKNFRWPIARQMFSFIGWGIYGTFCITGRTQGIGILLNRFYTTSINAAFGIAMQVAGQMNVLVSALTKAINPQIIKAEGSGDRQKMFRLAEISCKYSFILFAIPSIPVMFFIDDILKIWLKTVPDHTSMFCVFIILSTLLDQLTMNLTTANQAIGNIRNYTIGVNSLKILTLPAAYASLKSGFGPIGVMIIYAGFEFGCSAVRLIFLRQNGLSVRSYLNNVFVKILSPTVINIISCYLLSIVVEGWWFIAGVALSVIITAFTAYLFSLSKPEKDIVDNLLKAKLLKSC